MQATASATGAAGASGIRTMDRIVIIGSSGHAKVVVDVVEREGRYRIVGLIDDLRAAGELTMGIPVLGTVEALPALAATQDLRGAIVAVGDNFARAQLVERVARLCPALPFVTAIHPRASIAREVSIGPGSVVMAGACVNPGCVIGAHCILNTSASLDHDCTMDDFSSLAPRATTGGGCRIGACAAVGIGAVVTHGRRIGEHTVIGAGAVVLADVPAFTTSFGVPAKPAGTRRPGDRYL
jgi:sugar O-acyltransferase (sialic acid O-acetyltransferase NeuD family)